MLDRQPEDLESHPSPASDDIAARLSQMVRLQTVDGQHEPFAAFLRLIAELYPRVHANLERETVTDRGLLLHWRGSQPAESPVVLMAHFDVVPAFEADGWTHPPFDGIVSDGSVWGRGTLDDKGPLCVILEAVESLLGEAFTPQRDVYLWFGGDEETGSAAATAAAALFRERGVTPWLVLDEGGAVVDAPLPFIDVPAAMIGVGEKGSVNIVLEASGDAGHASAPSGLTPTARIARAVSRVERRPFPARLPRVAREMFATFLPHAEGSGKVALEALTRAPLLTAQALARLGGDAAAIVRTTLATTRLAGGSADNVLPASANATLNCRIAPGESVATTVRHVRRAIRDRDVRIRITDPNEPTELAPTDNTQFQLLSTAARAAYPDAIPAPYITLAATDAKHFQRFTPATYRFAPLAMDAVQRASIHGVDERVSIASLHAGKHFHETLLRSV
ncbi:M20/M25/M40 family metallo-hydrolase [Pseudoclavibacter helvolus]|uniref:M20/M25/M40 family metallo-hydrolase n=1 Tax=Pseudoclavibacter helvolus TaxID=255205 RepID=UPI003C795866